MGLQFDTLKPSHKDALYRQAMYVCIYFVMTICESFYVYSPWPKFVINFISIFCFGTQFYYIQIEYFQDHILVFSLCLLRAPSTPLKSTPEANNY